GARTDRSGRYQDHEINPRLSKERTNLTSWRQEIFRIMGKAKAVVDIGNTTNGAFCFQLKQPLQGKDQVQIAQGIAAGVVLMRETNFCAAGGARNDAKRSIALQVERLIGTDMHHCCA